MRLVDRPIREFNAASMKSRMQKHRAYRNAYVTLFGRRQEHTVCCLGREGLGHCQQFAVGRRPPMEVRNV